MRGRWFRQPGLTRSRTLQPLSALTLQSPVHARLRPRHLLGAACRDTTATTHLKMCLKLGQVLSPSTCTRAVELQHQSPTSSPTWLLHHTRHGTPLAPLMCFWDAVHCGGAPETVAQPQAISASHTNLCANCPHTHAWLCERPLASTLELQSSATARHCPESGAVLGQRTRLPPTSVHDKFVAQQQAPVTLSINGLCPTRTHRSLPETSRMSTRLKQCASQKGLLLAKHTFPSGHPQKRSRTFPISRNCGASCCLCRPQELLEHREVVGAFDSPL